MLLRVCTVCAPEGSPRSLSPLCVFPSKKRKETLGGAGENRVLSQCEVNIKETEVVPLSSS